jgi:hypothetical protein
MQGGGMVTRPTRKRPALAFCMAVLLVAARVLRRDSGRRLLTKIAVQRLVVTCEIGPGDEFGVA